MLLILNASGTKRQAEICAKNDVTLKLSIPSRHNTLPRFTERQPCADEASGQVVAHDTKATFLLFYGPTRISVPGGTQRVSSLLVEVLLW